jgi:hypothetical protein
MSVILFELTGTEAFTQIRSEVESANDADMGAEDNHRRRGGECDINYL